MCSSWAGAAGCSLGLARGRISKLGYAFSQFAAANYKFVGKARTSRTVQETGMISYKIRNVFVMKKTRFSTFCTRPQYENGHHRKNSTIRVFWCCSTPKTHWSATWRLRTGRENPMSPVQPPSLIVCASYYYRTVALPSLIINVFGAPWWENLIFFHPSVSNK